MRTFNIEDNEIIVSFYACLEKFANWLIELIQTIFENQFLKFVFYMWFVLFCLALVLWFLFDNYVMFDSMSIRKGNEFKKENKRKIREAERGSRLQSQKLIEETARNERYKKNLIDNEKIKLDYAKKRAEVWKDNYKNNVNRNLNSDDHKESYDLNKAIEQAKNGPIIYKKRKIKTNNNDDNN